MKNKFYSFKFFNKAVFIIWFFCSINTISIAQNIIFPNDAGVLNVKNPPFNAVGDGITDDTQAILAALDSATMKKPAKNPSKPRNALYAQSGGVSAVINASAAGVIETARKYPRYRRS